MSCSEITGARSHMSDLFFNVSFVGYDGLLDETSTNIVISGQMMNEVIMKTPQSKPKILYDNTIFYKENIKATILSQDSAFDGAMKGNVADMGNDDLNADDSETRVVFIHM